MYTDVYIYIYIYIYLCIYINAANLATLEPYSHDVSCISNLPGVSQQDCLGYSSNHGLNKLIPQHLLMKDLQENLLALTKLICLSVI